MVPTPPRKKSPPSDRWGFVFCLQIQQVGVNGLDDKRGGPESSFDIHLCISNVVLRSEGDLHIAAFAAHTHGAVEIVCTIGERKTEQFFVSDMANGIAVDINAEATCDSVGRTLTVEVNAGPCFGDYRLTALGTDRSLLRQVENLFAMRTFNSGFSCHVKTSLSFLECNSFWLGDSPITQL